MQIDDLTKKLLGEMETEKHTNNTRQSYAKETFEGKTGQK